MRHRFQYLQKVFCSPSALLSLILSHSATRSRCVPAEASVSSTQMCVPVWHPHSRQRGTEGQHLGIPLPWPKLLSLPQNVQQFTGMGQEMDLESSEGQWEDLCKSRQEEDEEDVIIWVVQSGEAAPVLAALAEKDLHLFCGTGDQCGTETPLKVKEKVMTLSKRYFPCDS